MAKKKTPTRSTITKKKSATTKAKAKIKSKSKKKKRSTAAGKKKESKYYFDPAAAMRVIHFFEKELRHVEGELAGQLVVLERWQQEFLAELFGWKETATGNRKYRVAYLEIPRKNGKSFLVSGLSLYLLLADGEMGAKVVSAAAEREQAGIIYNIARSMIHMNSKLKKLAKPYQRAIIVEHTASLFKAISAEAYSKHGMNLHGVLVDELHAHPNRDLVDVLKTSTGARSQPLEIYITTAGWDRNSICWEMHTYAQKVGDGSIKDPTFLPVIYAAGEKDDWRKKSTWKKANPNFGISVKEDYIERECQRAMEVPGYENTFKRLQLNIWTEQETRLIPMDQWRDVDAIKINQAELKNKPCYGGLDLAMTTDLVAAILLFPNDAHSQVQVLPHFWIPRENMEKRVRRDKVRYDVWEKQGLLTVIDGNIIDQEVVRRHILDWKSQFVIKEIAYDPHNASQLALTLESDGIPVVKCDQRGVNMGYPTKEFLAWIAARRIFHGGHPILDWMATNVVGVEDRKGNIRPDKNKSTDRVDGIVALIMGLWRVLLHEHEIELVYKKRGLIRL